jgi:hypothetical protein
MAEPTEASPRTLRLEALWIFKDEIRKVGLGQQVEALTSQPFGKPLHNHQGYIEVDDATVTLIEGGDRRRIGKSEIAGLQVSFDRNFTQADTRGISPPMHFSFGVNEVYIFTKGERFKFWQGKDTALSKAILRR